MDETALQTRIRRQQALSCLTESSTILPLLPGLSAIKIRPPANNVDYEIQRFTRHCTSSGRELKPGEVFYSALLREGAQVARHDYSADAWQGPPEGAIGWWKSQVPSQSTHKVHWAPNDVMLELLEQWEHDPLKQDIRYVLSLLLIRRRVVRVEDQETGDDGREMTILYCPRRETTYKVATVMPTAERETEIQNELGQLLFAGGPK